MKFTPLLAASLIALAGCSQHQIDNVQNAIATDAPKLASDGAIFAQIEAKFVEIDPNSALHVALAVHGGAVRLSGHVKSDDVEKRYTQAASQVTGVNHVNATMTVDPNLRSASRDVDDFALATAVRAHLAAQAGLNGLDLGIGAKSGVVTLRGAVPTAALHRTILTAARTTAGVHSVVDRLHLGS